MRPKPIEGIVEDAWLWISMADGDYKAYCLKLRVNGQDYDLCNYDVPMRVDRGERVRIWPCYSHPSMGLPDDEALQILDEEGNEKFCYKKTGDRRWTTDKSAAEFLNAKLEPEPK